MKNKHKSQRLYFVGSVFVISLITLVFIVLNFRENIVFFYSPSELPPLIVAKKIGKKPIRVGGLVVAGSVKKIDALSTDFVVTDMQAELLIHHRGIVPELFRENQGVVAKGLFDVEKNEFFSQELLIKHDENYMPPEVKESLKAK